MKQKKWDKRFKKLAKYTSRWSKDKIKVGAIVVSKRRTVVALGYNGFPVGVEDSAERLSNQDKKLDMIVHAEVNALISAGSKAEGGTIYVWGKPVCSRCAGLIIQAGITRVVALNPYPERKDSKWRKTGKIALEMFVESEIKFDLYENGDY
mgnify:CR=1 FL=1